MPKLSSQKLDKKKLNPENIKKEVEPTSTKQEVEPKKATFSLRISN